MVITKVPFQRSIEFLKDFNYRFKPFVSVIAIFVNQTPASLGTKRFVLNYVPKISFSHPAIQITTMRQTMYGPYIRIFYEDGSETLCDTSNKSSEEIMKNLGILIGIDKKHAEKENNKPYVPNFGYDCRYFCICQRPGQVMCSRHKNRIKKQ